MNARLNNTPFNGILFEKYENFGFILMITAFGNTLPSHYIYNRPKLQEPLSVIRGRALNQFFSHDFSKT